MNRIFRLVWNDTLGAWVAVSEKAKGRGKRSVRAGILLAPLMAALGLMPPAIAGPPPPSVRVPSATELPTGGNVIAGAAAIVAGNARLDVNQTSARAVINWDTFNLGSAAEVRFNQPDSHSATLNRVLDSNPSQILGKISANGQVFLSNPNGIVFGASASVDVGGLTATTHAIGDADFMAGKTTFQRNGATGSVVNEGQLRAALGGFIALLAPEVRNEGVIIARMGTVALASGEAITLNFAANHSLGSITVQPSTIRALVDNRGAVLAPGGMIVLSARALDRLQGGVVHNTGKLEATGLAMKGGRIVLEASDRIVNSGTINTNAGADGSPAGTVSLAAPVIVNSGVISAAGSAPAPVVGGAITLAAEKIEQSAGAVIDASGASGGVVRLQASGDVAIAGTVTVAATATTTAAATDPAQGQGGSVTVEAKANVTLADAVIDASGGRAGGSISVSGGAQAPANPAPDAPVNDRPTVALLGATELRSGSRRGRGGDVSLTADRVGLFDSTLIDTSGATGGGAVQVGGGLHGHNASLANASEVVMGARARIDASALENGDGGQVVLWSDLATSFAGRIEARGGAVSGDGALVEVSGKRKLAFNGMVDAGADHGQGGTLLLDPQNIVISSSGAAAGGDLLFATNAGADSVITPDSIAAIANATVGANGTAVLLQATDDITINSTLVTLASANYSAGALTFQAGRSILVNAGVISGNGALTFIVNDQSATGTRSGGAANFTNAGSIDAGNANLAVIVGSNAGGAGTISSGRMTANNLTINAGATVGGVVYAANAATAGALDLGGTTVQGNLTVNSGGQSITNVGASAVISVGNTATFNAVLGGARGDVIINPAELTSSIGTFAASGNNVSYTNAGPFQMGTTAATGNLTIKSIKGAIGSVGNITVGGNTTVTTTAGGFGYSAADLDWTNNNHFAGLLTVTSGGHASINDTGAVLLGKVVTSSYFSLLAGTGGTGNIVTTDTIGSGSTVTMVAGNNGSGDMTIGAALTASSNVALTAGANGTGDMLVNGSVTSSGGAVALNARGNFTANALVSAAGSLDLQAGKAGTGNIVLNTVASSNTLYAGSQLNLTAGYGGTAGSITGSGKLTTGSTMTLTSRGSANAGQITLSGVVTVPNQAIIDAGVANDVTIDNAQTDFAALRIVNAKNVTLVDKSAFQFGPIGNSGGYFSNIAGNLAVTAGGDISQYAYSDNNGWSTVTVGGDTVFTLTAPGSLLMGQTPASFTAGYTGHQNSFAGSVTLAKTGAGSYTNVYLRNNSANAGVLNGLAGSTLTNLLLNYNNAPSLSLPGYTATADSLVSVPLGSITQAGLVNGADAIVVGGVATFQSQNTKNINLSNPNNDFNKITIRSAYDATVTDVNALVLYSSSNNYNQISHDLTLTTGGAISDGNTGYWIRVDGTASFDAGSASVSLTRQDNAWNGLKVPHASDVTIYGGEGGTGRNWTLGDINITGNLYLQSWGANANGWNTILTQTPGAKVVAGANGTTTLNYFANIDLTNNGNVLGNLAMVTNWPGAGVTRIKEDDAITQASNWGQQGGQSVYLTTEHNQAVNLNQSGNDITYLSVVQLDPTAQTAGDVNVLVGTNLNQPAGAGGAWSTRGKTTINTQGNTLTLQNPLNVFAPLRLSGNGTNYVYARQNPVSGADAIVDFAAGGLTAANWASGNTDLRAYDSTGATQGAGNVRLTQGGNAIGAMAVWGNTVTITNGSSSGIQDWTPWKTTGVTTLDSGGYPIYLTNNPNITNTTSYNVLGPIAIVGSSAGTHPSAVNINENDAITQASAWTIGSAPVTLSSRTNAIDLSTPGNVLGALNVITTYGVPASVKVTEDDAITQGSLWNLPATAVTLNAQNNKTVSFGGYDNVFGNVGITGGAVTLRENANIIQDGTANGAWHTTGTTTLSIAQGHDFNYRIGLDNAANTFGPLAILGVADSSSYLGSVTLSANADITQAAPWNLMLVAANGGGTFYSPVTLNVGTTHDVTLDRSANLLGKLTVTAANATVVENKSIEDGGAGGIGWRVAGLTTLTAQSSSNSANEFNIDMVGADNDFGAVKIINGAAVAVTDKNDVVINGANVDATTGQLKVTAAGQITQSGAIVGDGLLLSGTGYATLNGPGNMVNQIAANFSGGDLQYTGNATYAVSASTGISIGAHNVRLVSTTGAVNELLRVNGSSSGLDVSTFTALTVPNTVSIAGYQTYQSAGGITLSGTMTSTAAGAITFNSPVTLGGGLQINNTSLTASPVVFNSTVAGAGYGLAINTRNGPVDFYQAVTDIGTAGTTLLLQGSGTTTFHSTLQANDGISVAGPLVLQDSVTIGHGAQASIFGGLVTLGKAGGMNISGYNNLSFNGGLKLQAGASTITSHDSTITLGGPVTGAYGLTLDAGAQNIIGISNIGSDITSLNATAGTIIVPGSFSIAGPQTYNATTLTVGGSMSSSAAGAITFNTPVTLSAASTISATDSPIVFGSTVNGSFNLALNAGTGAVSFADAVGHINKLGSGTGAALTLSGSGATTFAQTLETNSGISAAGATGFGANVTLGNGNTGTTLGGLASMGAITFSGYDGLAFNGGLSLSGDATILSNGSLLSFGNAVSGAYGLTLNALAAGQGSVTGLQWLSPSLTKLSVTANTLSLPAAGFAVSGPMDFTAAGGLTLNGNVGSTSGTGQIDFKSAVTLATGPIVVATANAAVNFLETVSGAQNLTVNAGSGALTFTKAVSNLGSGSGAALTVSGSGATTFAAALAANSGLVSSNGANLVFQNDATFANGDTGSDFGTGSLTIGRAGATSNLSGYQGLNFRGAVNLVAGPVAIDSHNGNVSVLGALNGAVNLTLDAGSGATSFSGPVGLATPLGTGTGYALNLLSSSLTTFGSTLATASGIQAAGPVAFSGNVTLGNGSVGTSFLGAATLNGPLTFSGRNGITFGGALALTGGDSVVNSNNSALAFNGAVNGAQGLTANAGNSSVVFSGALGAVTPLANLSVAANSIALPAVTTTGDQTYAAGTNGSGTIALGGNLTTTGSGNLNVSGGTTLGQDTSIVTGGSVTFNTARSTIDGAHNLSINAGTTGNVVLGGQLGLTDPLVNVSIAGNNLSLPNIIATGVQSYAARHDITLVQSRTAGTDISFSAGGALDGTGALILPTGISLNVTNHALTITAADLQLNGTSSMSTGSGLLTLAGVLGNDIYLGGSPTPASGQMAISGDELQRMSSSGGLLLATSGSGKITVDGISQAQSQNVSGVLQLRAQGSGAIDFLGGASTFNALSASAGGNVNLATNLTTNKKDIDFLTPVVVTDASTIASIVSGSTGGGDIRFASTVAVSQPLTITTGGGNLDFGNAVSSGSTLLLNLGGGTVTGLGQLQSSLSALTVNTTSALSLPAVHIAGAQVYNTGGNITLTGDVSGVGLAFNNVVQVAPSSGSALSVDAGTGAASFGSLVNIGANQFTVKGDEINLAGALVGTGGLTLRPSSAGVNTIVGAAGTTPGALNLTAAKLAQLPATLSALTFGQLGGSGTLDLAANYTQLGSTPLTLNGGGGITQSGGYLHAGALTLGSNGNISLGNAGNLFGALGFSGTPLAVSLRNGQDITQSGAWNLGTSSVTLNAGTHDITLTNAANAFGSLLLTGHNAQIKETGATSLGASTLDNLTVTSTGAIATSGALAITGLADLTTLNDAGAAISVANASTIGTFKARSRNGADTTIAGGAISYAPAGSSLVGVLRTSGNVTLTAASGQTLSEDGSSVIEADGLELLGAGSHVLTLGDNHITTLAGNTGNATLRENDGFVIGTVGTVGFTSGGTLSLSSTTGATESQRLNVNKLELLGAGGAWVLNDATNSVATVAGSTGSVSLGSSAGFDIGIANTVGLSTTGNTTLRSTGSVTQSQAINAAGLELLGAGGAFVLNNAANSFATVAGATGSVALTGNAGLDIGTVNTAGLATTGDLTLASTHNVTQSAALTAAGLHLLGAGGGYILNNSANDVASLAANTGSVKLTDNNGFDVAGVTTSGTLSLSSTGSVTQSQAISTTGLELLGAGGSFTLDHASNAFGTVAGSTGTVSLTDNHALSIGTVNTAGLATTGDLTLTSGATVTQSARIAAAGLNLQGAAGNFVLANPGNAITTLAGNTANASVTDNDGFTIGSVGATDGLTASGNLTLTSIAAVGQTKAINVAGLELLGTGGSFTLDDANNAITTLAGNTGTVSLTENSGFAIGAVNTVGLAATSQLTLSSTGGVTQAERIATPALALLGVGGSYVLNNGANALTTVALDTGSVKLTENSGFAIGSVGSTVGATTSATMSLTSGANVTQTQAISTTGLELLGAGGNFTLTNAGNSIPLLAGSTGDASIQTTGALEIGTVNSAGMGATGNLQLKANGIISQSQALAIGGDLLLQTTHNAGDVAVTNLHNSVLGSTSVGGNYTLTATGMEVTQRASTDVQVRGDINIDAASLVMGGAGNIVGGNTNMPTVAELRQSGMITLGTLGDLNVTGSYSVVSLASNKGYGGAAAVHGDAIVLNSAGNSIGGAIAVTTSGPTVIGGSEVLTGIQQAANSSIHISGTASFTAEASSVPGSGLITLNNPGNTFGSLVVSGSTVSVTETGDTSIGSAVATTGLTLHSTGAVSQTGPVITPLLAIGAANSVALNNANNDVATLAIQTAGAAISYRDANSFAIGSVDSINGIDTGAGAAVNLVAGGAGNITQSQAIVGATTLSASAGGSVLLADAGNTIGTLDAVSAGTGIDINDSTAGLTIGGNLASQGGNVQVHTEGGDLTLADGVTIGAGGSGNLALAAGVGFNFKNAWANTSANPITMGSGRFLIYSTNNSATALGGIAGAGYMGYTFAGNAPAGIGGSDNRILYQDQATLVFTATNQSRLYGDSDPTFTYSVSGLLAGDNLASAFGGLPALSTLLTQGSDVGSGAISIALGSVSSSKGYIFSFTDGVLTINARPVNLSGSRAYDGTVDVGNGIFSINNTYNGETLALTGAGTVGGKNVGSAKAVTTGLLALANGSGKASNYTLVGGTHTADITARVVGVSAAKEYDGGAALNGAVTLSTGVSGEALTYSGATASDANVATIGKYVNAITLADGAGGASANYQLPALDAAHAPVTITPKTVSISATRTYDGSSALAGVVSIATGIGGQALTYSGATAASSHVGAGNYIDAITLADGTGGVASNYQLPSLAAASASNGVTINAATLVASISNSGVSKVYDGTLSASGLVPSYNITGFASGDTGAVLAFTSALYDSAHVASASKVTVSGMSITSIAGSKGSLAGDYVLDAGSKEVAATISARTLTTSVSNTGVSKVYDGGTSAPAGFVPTFSVTGFASGDTGATIGSTGAVYDSAHVASASKVTVSGISLGAVAGANGSLTSDYALDATSKDVAATIAAKTVSLSAAKVYDGDVSLTGTVTVATGITGEALTYSGASAASSHVGAGNYIDAITLANGAGGLATDYQLPSLAAASASNGVTINAATLVASISNSGVSKVYDGTLSASGLTPSYNIIGFASGDIGAVLAFTSALYDSAHVVSASKVTVSGMSITSIAGSKGSLAGDYMLDAGSKEVAATISARTLTTSVSNAGVNKVYDGGTSAPSGFVPTFSVTGFASGDTGATIGSTGAVYDSAHVASASKVTVTGISLGAVAGANGSLTSDYALDATSKDVAATIGAKTVSLSAAKVYDGGVSLSGAVSLATGITGEALSYSGATASDANVATVGKYVSALTLLDGAGGLASDYRLPTLNGANAAVTITPKTVSLSGSKNYDGGTGLAGALSIATGIGGESLSYSGATANSSHVAGASYVDAITLGNGVGGTASNYQLPALNAAGAGNSFSINPATLVTTFTNTGVTKVYDGSVSAPAGFVPAYSVSGLASGDTGATITNSGVAYDSAHVLGATKLTVSGLAFAGVTGSAGSQLGDYVLDASSKNIAAGISARTLTTTVSNTGLNKVYDGDSSAPAGFVPTYAITGFASGDTGATVLNTGAAYDSTHAGQASKITVSGLSVGAVAGSAGSLAGDYALDATSKIVAATIGARTLTAVLSNAAVSKVYDGTVAASGFVPAFTFSGLAGADTGATLNYASAQYNASHVATATALNVSGLSISAISGSGGALASDYALASASQSVAGTITARTVGLSAGKVYDGGVGLTGAVSVVTGIGGESLNYSGAAGSNANVAAAGKFVSAITLQDGAGASASDYQLPMLDAAHAALTITPKTVSLSAAKTYDGTASLAGAVSIATGVGGESLGYTGATASDANVATAAKYISAINLADGTGGSASNYALPVLAFAGAPVVINPFTVGLSGSRAYNGTTVAAAASLNLLALPQGQTLGLTGSGSFSDAHVGNGKAVSLGSLALTNGTGLASNYTLAGASATISVTKAQLTASASVANRTYDGTTGATINALTLSGFVAGETVNAVASGGASFASKDAGAGKTVTVSGIGLLDGSGLASDYSVAAVVTTTANIARANLNVAGVVALDKVYDGGNSASINSSGAVLTGRFGSDNVSVGSITGTFADKNVGTAKAITTGAFVLSGSDALNYNLIQPAGLTASITPRSLVVSATGVGKVYDATTSATVSLADNRIAGDVFTIASTASFLDKNVGVNKFVNVSGISLSGTDAGNYAVNSSGAAFATIGKAALTIGATAQSRVYNGGTAATVTLSDNRLGTDALTVTSGAATFADKNVGNAKVVSVGGISVSGADAGNYSFNTSAAGSANITPATLTVSASAAAKPYDSSAAATVTLSDNRIGGDSLTLARTGAAFNSASVGTAKPVSVTGISIASGADKGNYVLASTTAAATADITVVYDSWILPSDLPLTAAPVPVVPAPGANAPRISSALLLPLAPQLPAAGQATPLFRLDLPASFDTGADDDATTRTTPGQEDQEQQRKRAARALKVIEVAMAPPPAGR